MTRRMPRSFLYVPAVKPALFDKAVSGPADAVILDLEDAVPLAQKDTARNDVAQWLDRPRDGGAQVWVRVTPEFLAEDLAAAARPGVTGIIVAKCGAASLAEADERLGDADIAMVGLVETAAALRGLTDLASSSRLVTVGIGGNDIGFSGINSDCAQESLSNPFGTPCRDRYTAGGTDQLQARITATAPKVASVLRAVRAAAPNAP